MTVLPTANGPIEVDDEGCEEDIVLIPREVIFGEEDEPKGAPAP